MGIAKTTSTLGHMQQLLDQLDIARIADERCMATAVETIQWAVDTLGDRLCVLSSMQDALLIDVALGVDPGIDVVFIDTGYHFPETHQMLRSVERRYGVSIDVVGPIGPVSETVVPGECCESKVELLDQALASRDGWISGISRVQTEQRADAPLVEVDRRNKLKINPLAQWNQGDRDRYIQRHGVSEHPLRAMGYSSIGCAPCTSLPVGADERSGRWAGTERTECGLHL